MPEAPNRPSSRVPATFVMVPGAGGRAWYWHRVANELVARGHEVVAVDLPASDDTAGLDDYVDTVVAAAGDRDRVVLVAQSMGGFSAPLVCERRPVELLVLLNPMIPLPGETGGSWWEATGQQPARAEHASRKGRTIRPDLDLVEDFFHDVPEDVTAEAMSVEVPQSTTPFSQPFPLDAWPDVPTRVLVGRDDRFFPADFQRRVAEERLGVTPDEMPGGHLLALSRPRELADRLDAYWTAIT